MPIAGISLYQHFTRKLKPAVAVAALLAGSVFCSTAQAKFVQLNVSGPSFSGYLFFDTSHAPKEYFGTGLYYSGFSFISSPIVDTSSPYYYNNPRNPFTNAPFAAAAPYPYLFQDALLIANPYHLGGDAYYYDIRMYNRNNNAYSYLESFNRQPDNSNLLIDAPVAFTGLDTNFGVLGDAPAYNVLFSGTGTISLPAVTTPPVSAVPEPASWAMALLGVGMLGGAVRYRRRQPGTATSQYRVA